MTISIITVCLNNEDLEKTILSVVNQTFKSYTHWIIDGGSENHITLKTLKDYSSQDNIRIISEKDHGIYDAMNKGIKNATSEYLIFLNAGDMFYSVQSLSLFVEGQDGQDIVYGDLEYVNDSSKFIFNYPDKLTYSFFLQNSLPHPACFVKKTLFERIGLYESSMKISADWAFFIKAICLYQVTYKHLPTVISVFDYNGISSMPENQPLLAEEKKYFLEKNFGLFLDDYIEHEKTSRQLTHLKNSRVRKYLSYLFKQLTIK